MITLAENDVVEVMTNSGEIITGRIEIAENALWADVDVIAVVMRHESEGE